MLLCVLLCFEVALYFDEFGLRVDASVNNQCEFFLVFVFNDIDVLPSLILDLFSVFFVFSQKLVNLSLELLSIFVLLLFLKVMFYTRFLVLFLLN